jgi:hypothetical protein
MRNHDPIPECNDDTLRGGPCAYSGVESRAAT